MKILAVLICACVRVCANDGDLLHSSIVIKPFDDARLRLNAKADRQPDPFEPHTIGVENRNGARVSASAIAALEAGAIVSSNAIAILSVDAMVLSLSAIASEVGTYRACVCRLLPGTRDAADYPLCAGLYLRAAAAAAAAGLGAQRWPSARSF